MIKTFNEYHYAKEVYWYGHWKNLDIIRDYEINKDMKGLSTFLESEFNHWVNTFNSGIPIYWNDVAYYLLTVDFYYEE